MMKIEEIFRLTDVQLKKALRSELSEQGYKNEHIHNKGKFLYAEGNAPYMLVAHLDTVHKEPPSIICYSKDGNYMMSPQGIGGDDRCGVYIILSLVKKLSFRPHVVFTMDEEIGGIGASAFSDYISKYDKMPKFKYILEFDRKGNRDCVFYGCDNDDFSNFITQFGFTEARGTFSDISIIAPMLGAAAVNLSSGYYNPHTEHEYVSVEDMHYTINAVYRMLNTKCKAFEYIEASSSYYRYREKRVSVSFLPKNSVYIQYISDGWQYPNGDQEVAIDEYGNYYRYSSTFKDLSTMHSKIIPMENTPTPKYDAKHSHSLPFYSF